MAVKVGFVSLGCPKNLINTEVMLAKLAAEGFEIVAEDVDADVIVINTCAFIESAKQEAIDNILDVAWLKENHTLRGIVVTGCLPERYREQLLEEMPEVDCILGTGSYGDICEAVRSAYAKKPLARFGDVNAAPLGGERVVTTQEHFAYLQIAEGCDNRCSYCVIPSIRGRFRSRPMGEIVEEARELAALGVRELCLVAQDTTRYGEDLYGTYALDALLRELSAVDGIRWLRLLYCYPGRITDGLVEEIASNPKVVKYIDMPIQHISDRVLRAMNRRDTAADIRSAVERLRSAVPDIVLRTTVITGFPGETEEEYQELKSFAKKFKFERCGVFPYSPEPRTPAAAFPDQVPAELAEQRSTELMKQQISIMKKLSKNQVGKTVRVLVDDVDENGAVARGAMDAPEIDNVIYIPKPKRLKPGKFCLVKITGTDGCDLIAELVK